MYLRYSKCIVLNKYQDISVLCPVEFALKRQLRIGGVLADLLSIGQVASIKNTN